MSTPNGLEPEFHELAAQQQHEAHLVDSAEDLYEHAPCGYLSTYPDGSNARVNATFCAWTGWSAQELVGRRKFAELLSAGGRIYHETHFDPLLRLQGSVRAIALDLVTADGSRLPVLVNATLRSDVAGRPLATRITVFDATERRAYEAELLAARRRAEQAVTWLGSIEQVVAELAAAPGMTEVSEIIERSATTVFGAVAGTVRLAASVAAGAPAPPIDLTGPQDLPGSVAARLRAGEVVRLEADAAAEVPQLVDALPGDGPVIVVPLRALDRTLGVLGLRLPRGERQVDEAEETRLLQTLGRQAGQALERARLSDNQRAVATTLQHSMLTTVLPDDPRLGLSTCYRPAGDLLEVGGDWYDAFLLDADRVAAVVGDVVGRGLPAAAAMGQLRSAVRALATIDAGPAALIERLDRFVDGVPAAAMATLVYAELDLRTGVLRYACAGHPPPVVVDAAGRAVVLWEGRSAPLGANFAGPAGGGRAEAVTTVRPGARVTLYSDGLVERRDRPLDECIDELAEVLGEWVNRPLELSTDELADRVLGAEGADDAAGGADDVCVLTVAFAPDPTFAVTVPARRAAVSGLRSDLSHWLETNGVLEDDRDCILLACSEVVSNSIEHGYADSGAGQVDVLATMRANLFRLRIRDAGVWRPRGAPGDRGRGLDLVRQLMDDVAVEHVAGTVVTMARQTS